VTGAADIRHRLDKLRVCGSVLMIAAHPDDENTALLSYFARGRKYRTAYLSLTRGEGGQNLIGPEQGEKLGLIRSQELLAARRIDGAEQYFTRAIDFGFSKTAEETLKKWGREAVLSDVVWVIRHFRPDVIVLRFSGTPRDGHGHHQASAILGREAFDAAADATRFPEQLTYAEPWRAKRVLFNLFAFTRGMEEQAATTPGRIEVELGAYDPLLGYSYGEIAGISRSMHRSQGFGSAERKGSMKAYLSVVAGEPAASDPMEGVDTTWSRIPGGSAVDTLLAQAAERFDFHKPEKILPELMAARARIASIDHPWARHKLAELDELIVDAAGLWVDASADQHTLTRGSEAGVVVTALNRRGAPLSVESWRVTLDKRTVATGTLPSGADSAKVTIRIPDTQPYSQPFWLEAPPDGGLYQVPDQRMRPKAENEPLLAARFRINIGRESIEIERPVIHRWVDQVRGELTRPVAVAPTVSVSLADRALIFPSDKPRPIEVMVRAHSANAKGQVSLQTSEGWTVVPRAQGFELPSEGQQKVLTFELTPPRGTASGELTAIAKVGAEAIEAGMVLIDYPHFQPQTMLAPAKTRLHRTNVASLVSKVGYIMGAGDEVPQALRQLGIEVTPLTPMEIATGDLSRYEAIVTGIRAFNTREDLRANAKRLFDYVAQGGTLVVQYNVLEFGFTGSRPRSMDNLGPYPLRLSRDRVTVEEAPMIPVNPNHPLLKVPNQITETDYEGWVQERGLYFPDQWDERYQPVWQTSDPGERPLLGATLYARHGKGVYIYTGLAFFRQLPAGVPGAYRIFANFLSAGKVSP
jgi:LmbE family N-acetylglucosaminyl deacetylase